MTYAVFGTKLKKAREAAGISGNELSRRTGIDQSLISKMETGSRGPSATVLEAIAERGGLGLAVEEMQAWADADQLGAGRLAQLADQVLKPQGVSPERFHEILNAIKALPQEDQDEVAADMLKMLQQRRRDRG